MTSLGQQLTTVQGAKSMQGIMSKTNRLLQGLNKTMDARAVHRMLIDYERQSSTFTASQEVVEETLDSMFETDGEQEATDDAMQGVLEELGLDLSFKLGAASAATSLQTEDVDLADIEARLSRLKASSQRQ
jgi:charged multivesicular body protein 2B